MKGRDFPFGYGVPDPVEERAAQTDALHHQVVARIERSGEFWIGTTRLKGHTWFRACAVNFRTTRAHMERLMELLDRECAAVEKSLPL